MPRECTGHSKHPLPTTQEKISSLTIQLKQQSFGLNWIDVPEAFEKESIEKIPILEEVKDKSITTDETSPTHILIEGDNFHALTSSENGNTTLFVSDVIH